MALVSEKRKKLNEQFHKLALKFSLDELKEHILPLFDDLTWELIKKAIMKYNLSTRMQDIAKLIAEYVKNFTIDDMRGTYGNLLLLDVILHNKRRTWTAVNIGPTKTDDIGQEDIARNIVRAFRMNTKNVNVYSDTSDDIRWFVVIISRRTMKQGIIYQSPVYLAHPLGSTILFISPKSVNPASLKMMVTGFGYDDYRILKLSGRNIDSLMKMLKRREDAVELRDEMSKALKPIENVPVISSKGIDFCQNKLRAEHAKELFGEESIELQTLTVNVLTEWRGVRTLPQAEGKSFKMTMRLKSPNVRKSLEDLVKKGVITQPYPHWAKEFLISGKNVITVG